MVPERKLYGSLSMTDISMVGAMHGVQFHDRKRAEDLMMIFDLNDTIDQLWIKVFVGFSMPWEWRIFNLPFSISVYLSLYVFVIVGSLFFLSFWNFSFMSSNQLY